MKVSPHSAALVTRKLRNWFICIALGLVLLSTFAPQFLQNPSPLNAADTKTEVRGVWLTNVASTVLFLPWGIQRALNQLSDLNFNTIYPVVWNRGHTFYPSPTAKAEIGRAQDAWLTIAHGGRDVLAELVKQGHRRHLRVIPWFEYGFMAPAESELVRRHRDWLTQRQDGSTITRIHETEVGPVDESSRSPWAKIRQVLANRRSPGQVWLNPLHPGVQDFILDLMTEVVAYYDIDGIQLDDHFGLPTEFGYDFYTVQLYQTEHQGQSPPSNPYDPGWIQWRAQKISQFMGRIHEVIHTIKPTCLISVSPNSQSFAYHYYLQDWQTWVKQGWVDELILQAYRNDLNAFQTELNQSTVQWAKTQIPVGIGIITGTWGKPIPIRQIQEQVEAAREAGFKGVSFFYWETLWGYLAPESPRHRRSSFKALFADPALSS